MRLFPDEIYLPLGPVAFLKVGKVWTVDIGSRRIFGIGWKIRLGRIDK